jgi:hypothetical protein
VSLRKSFVRRAAIAAALVAASTTAQAVPVSSDFSCISGSFIGCAAATSTPSVPEPGPAHLMIAGLGLLGFGFVRRWRRTR